MADPIMDAIKRARATNFDNMALSEFGRAVREVQETARLTKRFWPKVPLRDKPKPYRDAYLSGIKLETFRSNLLWLSR